MREKEKEKDREKEKERHRVGIETCCDISLIGFRQNGFRSNDVAPRYRRFDEFSKSIKLKIGNYRRNIGWGLLSKHLVLNKRGFEMLP